MSCSKLKCGIACCLLLSCAAASADSGYILGVGGEFDTSDGRALSAFADYGISEDTWLSGAFARTNTGGVLGGLDTVYADVALEHSIGSIGARIGAAYWGDADILDSRDLRGSVFVRGDSTSLSIDFERRDFDFDFSSTLSDVVQTVSFTADGIGGSGSLQVGDRTRLFASGMSYNYSRDIRLQPRIDNLRFLSNSRLSLMNSLIDYRFSAGVEQQIADSIVDLTFSNWQTAVDGGTVRSIAVGIIVPVGPASDLGFRVAFDESENFGSTVAFAVTYYYFGV